MLCRKSTIRHADSGVTVPTPLLIPSFSSKGFKRSSTSGKSEVGSIMKMVSEFLTDTFLVSAYDIFHGDLPRPEDLPCRPELIFVDSGGYEISTDLDYSSVTASPSHPKPWTTEKLESVLDRWPSEVPAVFVSFDHPDDRKTFAAQVEDARRLFQTRRQHLTLLLLKPETKDQHTLGKTIKEAAANAAGARAFRYRGGNRKRTRIEPCSIE